MRAAIARDVVIWMLLVLAFMWPAIYNGQAIAFFDTITYARGADTGILAALHHRSHWSSPRRSPANASAPSSQSPPPATASSDEDRTVLTGRSPFYGALVYVGDLFGGFWLTVVLQAVAVVAAITLIFSALRIPRAYLLPVGVALALLSSLPFYVSFLMPDIFTGIAIAGSAVLLAPTADLRRWELAAWWLLLSAGALFHDTNLLILCSLLVAATAIRALTGSRANWAGVLAISLAIMIGILGQIAFVLGIKRWVGVPPISPPFLTARLVDDRTAVKYLRATCPGNGFQVCSFLDRLPMPADDFLWLTRPGAGVFSTASPEEKHRLSAEQFRLARAVFAFDPAGQLLASLHNAAHQLVSIGLWEFEYDEKEKSTFDQRLPGDLLPRLHASNAYRGRMPIATYEKILIATFYWSVCFIAAVLGWPRLRQALLPPAYLSVVLWMLVGVLVNAVVCGVLSGPHERYSSRVQWLLPLAAMLMFAALARTSRRFESPSRTEAHGHGQVSEPLRFGTASAHGIEDQAALKAHEAEQCDRGGEDRGGKARHQPGLQVMNDDRDAQRERRHGE